MRYTIAHILMIKYLKVHNTEKYLLDLLLFVIKWKQQCQQAFLLL